MYKHIFVDLVMFQQGSERDVDVVVNFYFEGDSSIKADMMLTTHSILYRQIRR